MELFHQKMVVTLESEYMTDENKCAAPKIQPVNAELCDMFPILYNIYGGININLTLSVNKKQEVKL